MASGEIGAFNFTFAPEQGSFTTVMASIDYSDAATKATSMCIPFMLGF